MSIGSLGRLLGVWVAALGLGLASAGAQQQVHLKIIAFNDFHGNLESPGSFRANAQSPAVPVGGADYLVGYIASLKRENPLNVVVSAGDLTGASPLVSALFHDDDTIEVMNKIGLDINGVGNHEFDGGKKELLRKQHGGCWSKDRLAKCKADTAGRFGGAKFEYLAANVYDTATGKTIFPAYAIRTYGGVKVGFIGLTLKDTPANSLPSGVAGLRFADEANTINALVPRLHRQGVHAIVAIIHQGGYQKGGDASDINGCAGGLAGYPIEAIVNRLDDGVDLVLSAHTHVAYNCKVANRAGRRIPVTSADAFGRVITDIDVTLDRGTGHVAKVAARNVLVDRTNPAVQPDAAVRAIMDDYERRAAPLANRVVGSIAEEIAKPITASGESKMGEVIADAQLEATHSPANGGAVIALMNEDGVRTGLPYTAGSTGIAAGQVTYAALFGTQPFGNDLVTMTLTGAQIKTLLEEQFKGCGAGNPNSNEAVPERQRWQEVSKGFSYSWHRNRPPCDKVDPGSIRLNGSVIAPAARYRVTVNSFLAAGGEQMPVLKLGTDRHVGMQDIEALEMYFAKHHPVTSPQEERIQPLP